MMQLQASLPSAEAAGWQAVELDYRGGEVAMLVVVPTELAAFEAGLTPARLAEMRRPPVEPGRARAAALCFWLPHVAA